MNRTIHDKKFVQLILIFSFVLAAALFFGAGAQTGAVFVKVDTTTQGNWIGVYGSNGHNVVNNSASYPGYAQVAVTGQADWTWEPSTGDVRALRKASGADRIAATWFSNTSFTIDINFTDGASHEVALYCLDWDSHGRGQTVEVLNAATNGVLDTRAVTDFVGGKYLVWSLSGHVKLTVTRTAGDNAVVSGLFFAPAASTSPTATAAFVRTDTSTQGSWNGAYGADGYNVINDAASYPGYAQVTPSGQAAWTWAASTSDPRALRKASGADRIAATWFSNTTLTININLTDGGTHQVALYCLDWDDHGRGQTVEILNAASGAVLDARSLAGFIGGAYLVWNMSGNVTIRVTRTAGDNAVVSGLFFGPGGGGAAPPSVALTSPASGATFTAPASITINATASDADGTVTRVEFFQGATRLGEDTSSPYSFTWSGVAAGNYSLMARATDNSGATATSGAVNITVTGGGGGGTATAAFVRTDTSTRGSWNGTYGADGYNVINDAASYPGYAQVGASGQTAWTWAASTSDPRALRKASGADRIAATWFSNTTLTININLTDGATHQVALYCLDWDTNARGQTVEILNAASGAVLDARSLAGFNGGAYLVWNMSGNVTIRVTRTAGDNAVVSGLFFGPGGGGGGPDPRATFGEWSSVFTWPCIPIHLQLLPNGRVLLWQSDAQQAGNPGNTNAYVWDPGSGTFNLHQNTRTNVFCSGHSFLPDGRMLVTGGHIANDVGERHINVFDFNTNTWTAGPDMNAGRWYPTNCALPNGETVIISGTIDPATFNTMPQVYQTNGALRSLTNAILELPFYPWVHVAPNGRVFVSGPDPTTRYLDTAGAGSWATVDGTNHGLDRQYGGGVMYEPGKVLITGGGNPPTNSTEVIDLNAGSPSWRNVSSMANARRHMNSTLLPDGTVLVTGGSRLANNNAAGAILAAELWNPGSETWMTMASAPTPRLYHSTALLLPDGRVVSGGGGFPTALGDADHPNAEFYSPPYLFNGARPAISSAPANISYGQNFTVQTPDAASITQVTLVKLSAVTHTANMGQGFNRLSFARAGSALNVTAPGNANLAPPGHYMLFILNGNGVPSVARIVRIN